MNLYNEETEIKIEYFESLDSDPLRESTEIDRTEDINLEDTPSYSPVIKHIPIKEETWFRKINCFGKYQCRFCDLTYSTVQTLRHHVKVKHFKQASYLRTLILNNKRNSKLKCHICKKRFKLLTDLKAHVHTKHIKYMNPACSFCHATFENDSEILTHILHEHGTFRSKIYSCFICGYQTSKVSHFKQHVNTHNKIKSKKCKHCDYSTNYSPNLKIHERIHLDIKPYCCDFKGCNYRSSAKSALRSHQLKHDPDNNFLYCDKCSYKTVYKQSLKKHIDSHNRNSIRITVL